MGGQQEPRRKSRSALRWAALLALVAAAAACVYLVSTTRGPDPEDVETPRAEPALTDVAPPPRTVVVEEGESPHRRRQRLDLGPAPQAEQARRLPGGVMDLARPPQWTATLASPPAEPRPPDPFDRPPEAVDPRRRPVDPDVERLAVGVPVGVPTSPEVGEPDSD